ncbi:unnamed protein product [Vitrella brassicaformis CCMP3155]|uniref:Uncharacterized protein n=1 Tax=Vitrella brassicaformis (strain CCMP3155) TaxID=1169540 RepID=A0A0G4EIN7_VITBC|nr:unnamed protein product [Vitrella brassicaformis CCMP3155]|eukprot:CEL96868.1 unnamed protein product [Vitrella brassicaformis CCMP3155]
MELLHCLSLLDDSGRQTLQHLISRGAEGPQSEADIATAIPNAPLLGHDDVSPSAIDTSPFPPHPSSASRPSPLTMRLGSMPSDTCPQPQSLSDEEEAAGEGEDETADEIEEVGTEGESPSAPAIASPPTASTTLTLQLAAYSRGKTADPMACEDAFSLNPKTRALGVADGVGDIKNNHPFSSRELATSLMGCCNNASYAHNSSSSPLRHQNRAGRMITAAWEAAVKDGPMGATTATVVGLIERGDGSVGAHLATLGDSVAAVIRPHAGQGPTITGERLSAAADPRRPNPSLQRVAVVSVH